MARERSEGTDRPPQGPSHGRRILEIAMVAYILDLVSFGDEGEIKSSAADIDEMVRRARKGMGE